MPKRKACDLLEPTARSTGSHKRVRVEELVDQANAKSAQEFKSLYIKRGTLDYSLSDSNTRQRLEITFKFSNQLSHDEFIECFELIRSTSRRDYEDSGFGWHPKYKKREMMEDEMRYLLIRNAEASDDADSDRAGAIQGFLSFMLTHDSTPSVPVLYVFEIHLVQDLRKLGLGRHLMDIAEGIAQRVGVKKVSLTCFVSNKKAENFYRRRGYVTDACSPDDRVIRRKIIKPDFMILSRDVPHAAVDSR